MGLFGKKKNETELKDGLLQRKARERILDKADEAIRKAYKAQRIIFMEDGSIRYIDKANRVAKYDDDAFAQLMLDKMSAELDGVANAIAGRPMGGLYVLGITPLDIKAIVNELREKEAKRATR